MPQRFETLPTRRKLLLIGLASNGVAVLILSLALAAWEWSHYRGRAVATLTAHASIIADSLVPALVFGDGKAAGEIMASLGTDTNIMRAELRDADEKILARFDPPENTSAPTLALPPGVHMFAGGDLLYAREVVHGGERIGVLQLQFDVRSVYQDLLKKLLLITFAMTASLLFAMTLFTRFQKSVSGPLQELATRMNGVISQGDYASAVSVRGGGEFAALAGGFNTMLKVIGEREAALAAHQARLEETVRQRTEELNELNASLERRVTEELRKNREKDLMLIQQSRLAAMGEMIGNIAHQWRQPLNALSLLLANIQDAYERKELDQAYLDDSVGTGRRLIGKMSTTIDDFRNFFKPNRKEQLFSVARTIDDAVAITAASFRNAGISINREVRQDPLIRGFPNEYSQVVLNILNNAKDAIQVRQIAHGQVDILIDQMAGEVVVSVRDNGGGIEEDIMKRIFDPYFTTRDKGTGIGLYMSRMIIENNMNGKIEVSNAGNGAEFKIITPVSDDTRRDG